MNVAKVLGYLVGGGLALALSWAAYLIAVSPDVVSCNPVHSNSWAVLPGLGAGIVWIVIAIALHEER